MRTFTLRAERQDAGSRLDRWLAAATGGDVTRSRAQKLIRDGFVTVDGVPETKPSWGVREGAVVRVTVPDPVPMEAVAEDIPLDVVYEDADVLVVNKPRGLVVHPAPGNPRGTLVNAVLHRCGDLGSINDTLRPGIVHRLDKDTTGLIVVAKNDAAYGSLARQVRDRSLKRRYLAIVHGVLGSDNLVIEAPVGRHPIYRKRMAVVPSGRASTTVVYVLERLGVATLVECELRTGRTHQIRVHMSHIGHPVLGDPVYSRQRTEGLQGQALHAWKLGFEHPRERRYVEFTAEPPADFRDVLDRLRGEYGGQGGAA